MVRLAVGARYIVRGVKDGCRDSYTGDVGTGIVLRGICSVHPETGWEWGYWIQNFRPVDDGDAAIFRAMLEPIKKRGRVHV